MKGDARPRKHRLRSGTAERRGDDDLPSFNECRELRANFAGFLSRHGQKRQTLRASIDGEHAASMKRRGIVVKRKPGRPRLADGLQRTRLLAARFSAGEVETITAAAKAAGKTITDFIRSLLLQPAPESPCQ